MSSTPEDIRTHLRQTYGAIAGDVGAGGCCGSSSCCGSAPTTSRRLGYSDTDLAAAPAGADLGLGCGNPQAIASLRPGERVLDLGSGAGFDAFLAARQVGPGGSVIGVDMTPQMVERARGNAARTDLRNVEFRLGEIEHLPVESASVDVIMSNCVINLSTDKPAVFREAYRVLAPGGRLAISDVVSTAALPPELLNDPAAHAGCIAGASPVDDVRRFMSDAGFIDVQVTVQEDSRDLIADWSPGSGAQRFVVSAALEARKPR